MGGVLDEVLVSRNGHSAHRGEFSRLLRRLPRLREGRQTAFAKAIPEPCKQLRYQILTGWLHLEEKTFSVEVFQNEEEDEGIGGGD